MYQVFINQSSITFQQKTTKVDLVQPYNTINISSLDQVLSIVSRLKNVNNSEHFILQVTNLQLMWQYFYESVKIVNAAGGIVENLNGEWLFIYRNGKWDLPKGKVEKDEELAEAAVREVEEECGIKEIKLEAKLPTTYHVYWIADELILKPTYWFKMSGGDGQDLVPQTEEGIEKVEWFNPSNLDEVMENTYASIKKLLYEII
tara:strand:- start:1722 stop:2330 length:609 start_codon:yes stop_codon:yes gene_type:complete